VSHVAPLTRTRTEKDKTTIARRLSSRHPPLRLRCTAIAPDPLSWAWGDRKQLPLCARCHQSFRSLLHPRLLMPLALLAACRNLAIPLIHRVFLFSPCCNALAPSRLIRALLFTSCLPERPPSNNSQTLLCSYSLLTGIAVIGYTLVASLVQSTHRYHLLLKETCCSVSQDMELLSRLFGGRVCDLYFPVPSTL